MKQLITLLTLIFTSSALSQDWKQVPLADEFGDLTGETATVFRNDGKFKNSATSSDIAFIEVQFVTDKAFYFRIFEYETRNPANFLCDGIAVSIKLEDGRIFRDMLYKNYIGAYNIEIKNNFKYGGSQFLITPPTARQVRKLARKGEADIYTILSTYKGKFKASFTCGQSNYIFNMRGLN